MAENKQAADTQAADSQLEYAFNGVPANERKSLLSLTVVLAGYPIALSNFVIGGAVGVGMTFMDALLALFVGNLTLIIVVLATGILAYRNGLSTAFLSRKAFGSVGSSLFSVLLAISAITWISLNGDIFARLIASTFTWWPIPVSITSLLVVLMWMQSAIRGYKGLQFISFVGVPAALIMCVVGFVAVGMNSNWFVSLLDYVPVKPMTMTAATAAIVGGWVFGATITPDVCRFAKKESHVYIAGIVAFIVGCFGLQLVGAMVAQATGSGDFTKAMAALGLSLVAFFAAIFCLWTTQDNNIYGASLALQNVFKQTRLAGKVTHKHIAIAISCIAAVLAAGGIYTYILPAIQFLAVLIPPVPGLIIAEEFFVKQSNADKVINWNAIWAWLAGGIAGYLSLRYNFFVPPLLGLGTSLVMYIVLHKIKK